jgi:hypothetical protein
MRGLRPRPDGEEQHRQVRLMIEQGLGALPAKRGSTKFATMVVESPLKPKKD